MVVAERRTKMAAPPVEDLGSYHPVSKATVIKKDRVTYWLGVGAQPTVSAHNLLVKEGVVSAPKRAVKIPKPVKPEAPAEAAASEAANAAPAVATESPAAAETPATEAPAAEATGETAA